MGSKKQKVEGKPEYQGALAAANTKSPLQTELENQSLNVLQWRAKGDYRERPKSIFFNFADPAELRRHRALIANAGAQGTGALAGSGDGTALKLAKMNMDDENADSDARQYEQDVAQGTDRAAGIGGNLAEMDQARRLGVLSTTANVYGSSLSRPQNPAWYERLMGMAGQAGSAFAGSPAGSAAIAGLF